MPIVIDRLRVWDNDILIVDDLPTVPPGVRANVNSLAWTDTSLIYKKTGASDTNWTLVSIPTGEPFFNNYGSFYSDVTQANVNVGDVNYMTFNNVTHSLGISIVNSDEITFAQAGTYNIQFSALLTKTGGTPANIDIWLEKTGTPVPWTNTIVTVQGNTQKIVAAWNFFETVAAGEYVKLAWLSTDPNLSLFANPPVVGPPAIPGAPSVILTIDEVG